MSEDSQPNEIRLSRKGNNLVPIIRSKASISRKRSFPGYHQNYPVQVKRPRSLHQFPSTASKFNGSNNRWHERSLNDTNATSCDSFQSRRDVTRLQNTRNAAETPPTVSRRDQSAFHPSKVSSKSTKSPSSHLYSSTPYPCSSEIPNSHSSSSWKGERALTPPKPFSIRSIPPALCIDLSHVNLPIHSNIVPQRSADSLGNVFHPKISLYASHSKFRSGKITLNPDASTSMHFNTVADHLPIFDSHLSTRFPPHPVEIDLTLETTDPPHPQQKPSRIHNSEHCITTITAPLSNPSPKLTFGPIRSGHLYNLPKHKHDKPRRLLVLPGADDILNVSMHGFIDKLYSTPSHRRQHVRIPIDPTREMVADACVVTALETSLLVLGHRRDENQVSLYCLDQETIRHVGSLNHQVRANKLNGTSSVCAMLQPSMFATGTIDHFVYLWKVQEGFSTSTQYLAIKHTAHIQSLLPIRDSSHKLISAGADCTVNIYDLSSERVVNTWKTSNSVYHVHRTTSPYCTLFQVDHRDQQFEIRDHRLIPTVPVQRFGFDCNQKPGRYSKGDSYSNLFAYGDKEGSVRVWDLRNVNKPLMNLQLVAGKIAHVVFHQSNLVASSEDNHIASVSYSMSST